MKSWYLVVGLAIAVIVLLSLREGFSATATIKNPATWDAAEIERVRGMVSPRPIASDRDLKRVAGDFWTVWSNETLQITTQQIVDFVETRYPNEPASAKKEIRDVLKAYYIDQGQSVFQAARDTRPDVTTTPGTGTTTAATTTTGTTTAATTTPASTSTSSTAESGTTTGTGLTVEGPGSGGIGAPDTENTTGGLGIPRNYPVLYGGMHNYASALPTAASLGTQAGSELYPFARFPGDQDIYPDPYRVGKYFSTNAYAPEGPEPSPVLADFSKFFT